MRGRIDPDLVIYHENVNMLKGENAIQLLQAEPVSIRQTSAKKPTFSKNKYMETI